ncbi:MAG: M15 family metallopeptidase [Legionellales bacterium]
MFNSIKVIYSFLCTTLFLSSSVCASALNNEINTEHFTSSISPIPKSVQETMKQFTWHPGCPIGLDQLSYIQMSYWGFDNKTHQGVLIVNKELASEVVVIFKKLFKLKFPIQSMRPMDDFKGSDDASMAANNTSSFNCRDITNKPGFFSQHSYGRAIDINPLINPFVKGSQVLPPEGSRFIDRQQPAPGKILKDDPVFILFTQNSWDWGANWYDLQDHQHFEKRANGEKRDPYGIIP